MKFSEMPYVRPDKDEILRRLAELTDQLKAADSFAAASRVFARRTIPSTG